MKSLIVRQRAAALEPGAHLGFSSTAVVHGEAALDPDLDGAEAQLFSGECDSLLRHSSHDSVLVGLARRFVWDLDINLSSRDFFEDLE